MVDLVLGILSSGVERLSFSHEGLSIELERYKPGVTLTKEEYDLLLKNKGFKLCIDDKTIIATVKPDPVPVVKDDDSKKTEKKPATQPPTQPPTTQQPTVPTTPKSE